MSATFDRLAAALSDRYRLERELGQGGMATVYLAHDLKHDRQVAVKVLRPELAAVIGAARFLAEIKTTANLQHPHILPLHDSGEVDGTVFYVMPFVDGETLRDRLERERQLPIGDAIRISREVASALDYAHRKGVIHRDIKPENILLHEGQALVADFGIALAAASTGSSRMTETGMSLGTPHYMSPEQAMGERTLDARADVYALGCVLYELLIGEPPFTGPTAQAIVARVLSGSPEPPSVRRSTVPANVNAAVLTALQKLPADRFATASEFAAALADPDSGAGYASRATTARAATSLRITPRSIAAALALVIGGAALGALAMRESRANSSADGAFTATSLLPPPDGTFGEQRSLALSPDGRRLAFVFAAANGTRSLWIRSVDGLDAEAVAGSTAADAPFWSPDGRSLGFFAGGYLIVTDATGQLRRLCPAGGATGGSWSTTGLILFSDDEGISTVPAGGGTCQRVVPRGAGQRLKVRVLPDGKRMLISRGRFQEMVVATLDGTTIKTLPIHTSEFAVVAPGYLLTQSETDPRALDAYRLNLASLAVEGSFVRVASEVRSQSGIPSFSVSANGVLAYLPGGQDRPYLVYDAAGVLRDTVRVEGTWTVGVRPARAGPATVAVAGNYAGIWIYDLEASRATRVLVNDSTFPTTGFAFGTTYPVFNADGTHMVYAMRGTNKCRIVDRDLRTSAERVIGTAISRGSGESGCLSPVDWSVDGRFLMVRLDSTLRIIPVDGSAEVGAIVRPGQVREGRFSPDGRLVAFSSEESGRAEIYVQALPSGAPVVVSLDGGRWPAWTRGGRALTYATPDGRVETAEISAAGVPVGKPRAVFTIPTWRRSTFDDNGTGLAVVGDGDRYLVRQSASGLAVAYLQHWPTLFQRADSTTRGTP